MLKENKCALCKHFIFDRTWIRKCKAYPNGIPDDILMITVLTKTASRKFVISSINPITINRPQQ